MSSVQQRNGHSRDAMPARPRVQLISIEHMTHFGEVKFYDDDRKFGFLVPDGGGQDVFVHQSTAHLYGFRRGDLFKGLRVGFCIQPQPGKRPEATALAIA